MGSTQFIHVAQFLETIFCFSLLILIGQRFIMAWKNLDQKYLQLKAKQLEQQIKWQKLHSSQLSTKQQNSQKETHQNNQTNIHNQQIPNLAKQQNLRSSLVQNEHDQTERKMSQNNDESKNKEYKRKSLTDLVKQQQRSSKQIQIKDDSSIANQSRRQSEIKQLDNVHSKNTDGVQKPQFMDLNNLEPSIMSNNSNGEEILKKQGAVNIKIHIFTLIDTIFNQHLPILMPILVLGILVHSTYIFVMVSLFGYIFTHLLLKHKNSMAKLRNQYDQTSFISKLINILPNIWIIAIFISYWADKQYS